MVTIKMQHLDGTREVRFPDENGIWTSLRAREDGTLDVDELTLELMAHAGHRFVPVVSTTSAAAAMRATVEADVADRLDGLPG